MIDQNPLLGFTANPQVPRTCNFNPGLAPSLILRKGFSDYVSTIVLGFPELRKQWEHQTKEDPIEQSCPSPATGFSPSISLYPTSCRDTANFHCTRPSKILKRYQTFIFWFEENETKINLAFSKEGGCETHQSNSYDPKY